MTGKIDTAIDNISMLHNLFVSRANPISLVHFVTNRCNARCSFCFIDFDDPNTFAGELTIDEIDKLTKSIGPNLQNVNLTGGEPFARKDFLEILRCYFRNTKIQTALITTNGSLPDRVERTLTSISSEFPNKKILMQFSIDAWPEEHDRIRKIKGLFANALKSYGLTKKFGNNVQGNIAITVSHENHKIVHKLYNYLREECGVDSITAGIVRDEGVYRIPSQEKAEIYTAYKQLTDTITADLMAGNLRGWNEKTFQGRMMNQKNRIMYGIMDQIYMEPQYLTPCRAGSIFGVIEANGKVRPCEILEKSAGFLRDYDMNLVNLWKDLPAEGLRKWIKETKCNCHYDCAWTFNILSNSEFRWPLAKSAIGLKS